MFIVGLALFTIGSFLAGLAHSFELLLAGRVVQGVGGAIASPTALSLITTEFEEGPDRTRAHRACTPRSPVPAPRSACCSAACSPTTSPGAGCCSSTSRSASSLIVGAFLYLHESERLKGRFDFVGAAAVGRRHGRAGLRLHPRRAQRLEQHPDHRRCFVAGRRAARRLRRATRRKVAADPMMPMRIFENRNRAGAYLVMLIIGAAHVRHVLLRHLLRPGRARVQRR